MLQDFVIFSLSFIRRGTSFWQARHHGTSSLRIRLKVLDMQSVDQRSCSPFWQSLMLQVSLNPSQKSWQSLRTTDVDLCSKANAFTALNVSRRSNLLMFALWAGIVMDSVYSGKAFHAFQKDMQANPAEWKGRKVLFLHTGGLLGMYSEAAELQTLLEKQGRAHRLDVKAVPL